MVPSHLHYPHQASIKTTTTTTTTAATSSETNEFIDNDRGQLPHTEALISSSGAYDESMSYPDTTPTSTSPSNFMSSSGHAADSSSYINHPSKADAPYTTSTNMSQLATNQSQADRRRIPHNRAIVPGSFIKTRHCQEDENFCSIVSVVRIEFVQDNLYSKFWALERNCSKSCNTGCMVIGERVRLRVCSQCCRTPDCNVGNGAGSNSYLFLLSNSDLVNLVLSVLFGLVLILTIESDMIIR